MMILWWLHVDINGKTHSAMEEIARRVVVGLSYYPTFVATCGKLVSIWAVRTQLHILSRDTWIYLA